MRRDTRRVSPWPWAGLKSGLQSRADPRYVEGMKEKPKPLTDAGIKARSLSRWENEGGASKAPKRHRDPNQLAAGPKGGVGAGRERRSDA